MIGLIVGFVNTEGKSSQIFLFAGLSIVIVGALGVGALEYISLNNYIVSSLRNVLSSLLVLFIPATIIVALKTVFSMAKI